MSQLSPNPPATGHAGQYPHALRAVFDRPWLLLPSTLRTIAELVAFRAAGGRLTDAEIAERLAAAHAARPKRDAGQATGSVALLPLFGVLTPRADMLSSISGGTSLELWGHAFQELVDDPQVSTILIEVDSPGGQVDLVPETAAQIRAARSSTRIVAVANTMCASGAMWLASQADEIVASPSSSLGSIGVYVVHEDHSVEREMEGIRTTLISAGKFKVEGNWLEPLAEEARAAIQADVDTLYGMFVDSVAKGRGVTTAAVRSGFGMGRMLLAKDAVAEGLADRVGTLQETIARFVGGDSSSEFAGALDALSAAGRTMGGQARAATLRTLVDELQRARDA